MFIDIEKNMYNVLYLYWLQLKVDWWQKNRRICLLSLKNIIYFVLFLLILFLVVAKYSEWAGEREPGCRVVLHFPSSQLKSQIFLLCFPSSCSPCSHFSSWFVHSLQDRQLGMPYIGKVTEAVTKALRLQSEWTL